MLGSMNVPPIAHVVGRVGCLGRWSPASTYNLVGSLSDGRVYDHALSDKEVKESLLRLRCCTISLMNMKSRLRIWPGGVTSFYSPYHTLEVW